MWQHNSVKNIFALEQVSLSSQNEQTFSLEKDRMISVGQNNECGSDENCKIDHALLIISSSIFRHLCVSIMCSTAAYFMRDIKKVCKIDVVIKKWVLR